MNHLTHNYDDVQSEVDHTYYDPETQFELSKAAMQVKDMHYADFVRACSSSMREATQISREQGIAAAGPYYDIASGFALSALTTAPLPFRKLPNLYETAAEEIQEADTDPDSSILLLYGEALKKQHEAMKAGFKRPYHKNINTPPSTFLLTEADRRERLLAGSEICFEEAWRIVMKGTASIETKAKSGIVVVSGLVTCDEIGRARVIAEQTDRMITGIDLREAGSKALQAFSRADESDELVDVAQEVSDSAVLEITDELKLALAA